jgi:hypothetical protein
MVKALDSDRYFRWFDSGDMYAIGLAEKMLQVMQRTPWVKHWLPTRMHKFTKFQDIIAKMDALDNVVVRRSSDSIVGEILDAPWSSTIATSFNAASVKVCEAYQHEGKCSGCRACWDKSVSTIGYIAHGVKMSKVIKLKIA